MCTSSDWPSPRHSSRLWLIVLIGPHWTFAFGICRTTWSQIICLMYYCQDIMTALDNMTKRYCIRIPYYSFNEVMNNKNSSICFKHCCFIVSRPWLSPSETVSKCLHVFGNIWREDYDSDIFWPLDMTGLVARQASVCWACVMYDCTGILLLSAAFLLVFLWL